MIDTECQGSPAGQEGAGPAFDAPWWQLLLWALVLIAALLAFEYLGIPG